MRRGSATEDEVDLAATVCERCGGVGSVCVSTVGPNRGGAPARAGERILCRACARAGGILLRAEEDRPPPEEPDLPSWDQVAQHLRAYEQTLREAPELRDITLEMARSLWHYAQRIPGQMPSELFSGLQRLGVATA